MRKMTLLLYDRNEKKYSSDQLKNYDNFSLSDIMGDLRGAFSIFQKD